jgi:hypothetical protein
MKFSHSFSTQKNKLAQGGKKLIYRLYIEKSDSNIV